MRVLAFDTATTATAVALRDIDTDANACLRTELDLAKVDDPPPGARPGHAQKLLVLITALFEQAGCGWDAIDRIAVGIGPGTFTGLRIGVATANALSRTTGVPAVGVSTLTSLALRAHDRRPGSMKLAVIDARRGEAFVAAWPAGEDPLTAEAALAPCVLAPDQLAQAARPSAETLAVGDGAARFRAFLERAGVEVPPAQSPLHRVSAREHCRLATLLQPPVDGHIEPQYLRVPDAETARS